MSKLLEKDLPSGDQFTVAENQGVLNAWITRKKKEWEESQEFACLGLHEKPDGEWAMTCYLQLSGYPFAISEKGIQVPVGEKKLPVTFTFEQMQAVVSTLEMLKVIDPTNASIIDFAGL